MQRPLRLPLLLALALCWTRPALADPRPPYLVYAGFGQNPLAERARDYLSDQLEVFNRWLGAPIRIPAFPGFEVRPWPASGVTSGDPRILAIVDGRFAGQEQNEANARVDIGNSRTLSLLDNPASLFQPVRGVVRTGARGDLRTSMGMYETIIQYSLLVRAFEQSDRQLFAFVFAHLAGTIAQTRQELGTTLSFTCLRQIEQNAARMRGSWDPAVRARAVSLPQKNLQC